MIRMAEKMSLSIEIKKNSIESIIISSDLIPDNELHVQKGAGYAAKLENFAKSNVSIALVAKADKRYGCPGYTIGYINEAKVVFNDKQAKPLMINHPMIQRAVKDFTDNAVYSSYELEIISPPIDQLKFLESKRALASYATPDSA